MGTASQLLNAVLSWFSGIKLAEWIGIAGFVLAVNGHFYKRRQIKRDAQRQDVLILLTKLGATCEEAAEEIIRHLCFQKARKSKEDIYRTLQRAKRELTALESRLPEKRSELLRTYTEWYSIVTGDGFPVDRKVNCFKTTDGRVQNTISAQTALAQELDRIRLGCLSDKIRYWA